MGSGKSTFGKKLATKLNMSYADLDNLIVSTSQYSTVAELVEVCGIDFFRAKEAETLRGLPTSGKLISTGGGTPCFLDNMYWMKQHGVVVFLQVDENIIFSRLKSTDLSQRPLLKGLDESGLKNFIHQSLEERLPVYRQAHILFNPITGSVDDLVKMIEELFKN